MQEADLMISYAESVSQVAFSPWLIYYLFAKDRGQCGYLPHRMAPKATWPQLVVLLCRILSAICSASARGLLAGKQLFARPLPACDHECKSRSRSTKWSVHHCCELGQKETEHRRKRLPSAARFPRWRAHLGRNWLAILPTLALLAASIFSACSRASSKRRATAPCISCHLIEIKTRNYNY